MNETDVKLAAIYNTLAFTLGEPMVSLEPNWERVHDLIEKVRRRIVAKEESKCP